MKSKLALTLFIGKVWNPNSNIPLIPWRMGAMALLIALCVLVTLTPFAIVGIYHEGLTWQATPRIKSIMEIGIIFFSAGSVNMILCVLIALLKR